MKCNECGAEVSPEEKFCGSCGAPVEAAEEPIQPELTKEEFGAKETLILHSPVQPEPPEEPADLPPLPPLDELQPPEPVAEFEPPPVAGPERLAEAPIIPPPPPPPSPAAAAQGGKNKTGLIIAIAVIVVLLLCCCCIGGVAIFLSSEMGQDLLWELGIGVILPLL